MNSIHPGHILTSIIEDLTPKDPEEARAYRKHPDGLALVGHMRGFSPPEALSKGNVSSSPCSMERARSLSHSMSRKDTSRWRSKALTSQNEQGCSAG